MSEASVSRRTFIQTSAAVAAAGQLAGQAFAAPAPSKALGANDRIRIGFIGVGGRGSNHVSSLTKIKKGGANIDLVAVSDVYSRHQDRAAETIRNDTDFDCEKFEDYRDMLAGDKVDAVCIGTPDHWHAKQTIDALKAGKHVYCEKPMTHTIQEAMDVVDAWKESGKVMQVGVQSTSLPVWDHCRELINEGRLGKMLQFQTEYYRNSEVGQWRYYKLEKEMTPKTINWRRFLGVDEGLAPDMPFDRAKYKQWRCYWPFGSGMYTDLFVHRLTAMLKATGLRYPARVVGAGGIFLEYDGRDVPDVATVVADYHEGVQGIITSTMCCEETPLKQVIRGHFGSFVFGNGEHFPAFDYVPERHQVTKNDKLKEQKIEVGEVSDTTTAHFKNFVDCMFAGTPDKVNNTPELGAAAIVTVNLGAQSYREGKAYFFDVDAKKERLADSSWAAQWESMSQSGASPRHQAGWKAGDHGSKLRPPEWMALAGPWVDGQPPENRSKGG
jgi:predicted dehydrogenase